MTSCPRRLRYSNQIRKEISRKVATGAGRASGKSSPLARGNCGWATIQTRKTADPGCSTVSLQDMLYHVCLIQVYIYIISLICCQFPTATPILKMSNLQVTQLPCEPWVSPNDMWPPRWKATEDLLPWQLSTGFIQVGVLGMQTHAT